MSLADHRSRSVLTRTAALLALTYPAAAQFSGEQVISTIDNGWSAHAADLDGDGDVDVLSASATDGLFWHPNVGGGSFGPKETIHAQGCFQVTTADLDGDGDQDVLSLGNDLSWNENLGAGGFGPQQVITAWSGWGMHATDLDGDADPDVLVIGFHGTVAWIENLGGGSFAPPQTIATSSGQAYEVTAADLDGDGDPDVLYGRGTQVLWLENLGGGAFATPVVVGGLGSTAVSVHASDLDVDGDLDVLAAYEGHSVFWYENVGGGDFAGGQWVTSLNGTWPGTVRACDLDGDGDDDVLSSSSGVGGLTWSENLGDGSFAQRVLQGGSHALDCADLDGDGDEDVLGASFDNFSWFENQPRPAQNPLNGHWYLVVDVKLPWSLARTHAEYHSFLGEPGHLVTITDAAEGDFVHDLLGGGSASRTWLGAYQDTGAPSYSEPDGGWTWVTGEPFAYTDWAVGQPDNGGGNEHVLSSSPSGPWNDDHDNAHSGPDWRIVVEWEPAYVGDVYCSPAVPNSTGSGGRIVGTGSTIVADNDLTLTALDLPAQQFGYFLVSETQGSIMPPHSQGFLCLQGNIGRFQNDVIQGPCASLQIDLTSLPLNPTQAVLPGETWNFQCWYRDMNPDATSNFTDAVSIAFQ